MLAETASETCHVKACEQEATQACDRCGKLYCSSHLHQLTIERRQNHPHTQSHRETLMRQPTETETYQLCATCWKKPVLGKHPLPEL